jgi:ABC-type methionine transport system permease subunit
MAGCGKSIGVRRTVAVVTANANNVKNTKAADNTQNLKTNIIKNMPFIAVCVVVIFCNICSRFAQFVFKIAVTPVLVDVLANHYFSVHIAFVGDARTTAG